MCPSHYPITAGMVPAADAVLNAIASDVIGNKTDTAINVKDTTSSVVRYLKGILDAVGIGSGINQGAVYYGVVTAVPGANQFTIPTLAGLGAGKFYDATAPYRAFVLRDAGGAAAAPQGEQQSVTAYSPASGVFTTAAFTAAVAVGDEILLVHPRLAEVATILGLHAVPTADAATNTYMRDVLGIKTDTAITVKDNVSSAMRYLKGLMDSKTRQLFSMDFWSAPQEEVAIPAVAATLTLPSVVVADLPAGATIVMAIAIVKFRAIENTPAGANKLSGATVAATSQVIQVQDSAAGGWVDAINFVDDQFGIAGSTREGGDVLLGSIDIAVRVDANDTYSFRYLLALADVASLNWNDLQCGLRIWYSG